MGKYPKLTKVRMIWPVDRLEPGVQGRHYIDEIRLYMRYSGVSGKKPKLLKVLTHHRDSVFVKNMTQALLAAGAEQHEHDAVIFEPEDFSTTFLKRV